MKYIGISIVWILVVVGALMYVHKASVRRCICNILKAVLTLCGILVVPFLVLEVVLYTRFWEQLCIVAGLDPEIAAMCKPYVWQVLFLITILVATGLLIVYLKGKKRKENNTTGLPATPSKRFEARKDIPIRSWVEDILNRKPFVKVLKSAINGVDVRKEAEYIGIFGDWGTGKTSVINLLKHDLLAENSAIFVDFTPWEFRNSDDAVDGFMRAIADVAWRNGEYRVADCFSNYLQTIRLRKTDVDYGSVGLMLEFVRWKLYRIVFNSHRRRSFLSRQLRLMRRKMIVVVDDLERMPQKDVCDILKTIKTTLNLPNLIFLIISSKKHLLKAAAKYLGSAPSDADEKECLLKIVQFHFNLPAVPKSGIMQFFKLRLRKVLKDSGYTYDDYNVETDNGDGYETAVVYVQTLRSALILANSVWEMLAYLRNITANGQINVHIGDVVALCAIRLIDEDFYNALPSLFSMFMDAYKEGYLFGDRRIAEKEFKEWWDENTVEEHREACLAFLKVRLGMEEFHDKDKGKAYTLKGLFTDRQEMLAQYRLASPECFREYFFDFSAVRHVPKSVLIDFVNRVKRSEEVGEIFEENRKRSELPNLLFSLEGLPQLPTDDAIKHYFQQLFMLARNEFAESEYLYTGIDGMPDNIYTGIWRCVLRYCGRYHHTAGSDDRLNDIGHAGSILFNAIEEVPEVHLIWRWLRSEYSTYTDDLKYRDTFSSNRLRSSLFDIDQYENLQDIYLDAVESYQKVDKLFDDREFFDLMRCWNVCLLARHNEERYANLQSLLASNMGSVANASKLIPFISQSETKFGDRIKLGAISFLPVDVNGALRLFGKELLEKILATFSRNMDALDINQRATAFALKYIIDNDFDENACTNDKQITHIRNLVDEIVVNSQTTNGKENV